MALVTGSPSTCPSRRQEAGKRDVAILLLQAAWSGHSDTMTKRMNSTNRLRYAIVTTWSVALFLALLSGCERGPTPQERDATAALLAGSWQNVVTAGETWTVREGSNPVAHFVLSFGYNYTERREQQKAELRTAFADEVSTKRVVRWAEALARENPGNPRSHWVYGNVLEESGDLTSAGREYEKAVQLDPTLYEGYQALGTLRLSLKEYSRALSCYKKMIELRPKSPVGYNCEAILHLTQNDMAAATTCFERAADVAPNDVATLYNLAAAYRDVGRTEEARKLLERVVALDPKGMVAPDARSILRSL